MPNTNHAVELGDAAFNVMDYLLDNAEYKDGCVILRHKADEIFCYTRRQLSEELQYVANEVLKKKYGKTPSDIVEISQNAIEEYEDELLESFPRKTRTASKQRVA